MTRKAENEQWRNQSERATWSTDQQAGTSYGGRRINPSPIFEGKCQCVDEILHPKCNLIINIDSVISVHASCTCRTKLDDEMKKKL